MIIVSDAAVLILLARIDTLDLLHSLFTTISIPQAVYQEVTSAGTDRPGAQAVAEAPWIQIGSVKNRRAVNRLKSVHQLGQGESEAIVLAQELKADYLILDDLPARRAARARRLPIIGTIGLLLLAKEQGLIPAVKPLLDALVAAKLRIHPTLYQEVLKRAGEL